MMSHAATDPADARRPSRLAAAATGAAVLGLCLAYAGWSLLAGRGVEEPGPVDEGVALATTSETTSEETPELASVPERPPTARLTLDVAEVSDDAAVVNAHMVEAADSTMESVEPAVQQLGFVAASERTKPAGAVGAWLTGGIEATADGSDRPRPARR